MCEYIISKQKALNYTREIIIPQDTILSIWNIDKIENNALYLKECVQIFNCADVDKIKKYILQNFSKLSELIHIDISKKEDMFFTGWM